ncbi:MAG TPA: dihydrolipoamide acetyltransferase family protein [Jatrophihabitantaceae bacterium]|nr:dihydrolipoamide acetyltransferase family protein [Jatrophihabitantaceae bacterium]
MTDIKQFKLPDIGEGLTEADILNWQVQVGDVVEVNQILVEVETAKAAVELPSPFAGLVTALHVAAGQTVNVGTAIISIDVAPGAALPDATTAPAAGAVGSAAEDLVPLPEVPGLAGETGMVGRQSVLVGYGPRAEGAIARRRRRSEATTPSAQTAFNVPPDAPPEATPQPAHVVAAHRVLAKPPVRKLAKSLGIDLGAVRPTGPNGTVSREDVAQAANGSVTRDTAPRTASDGGGGGGGGGGETRIPIRGVRKHTAAAMVSSAFTAPHVTEFVTIDVTQMMQLRERVAARRDFRDVKVSPLLFVAKAVILAAKRTPEINATWDDAAGELVLKHYVNLGIAAATDRGLIVPNIKAADQLSLLELAQAMTALTDLARSGKTPPSDMAGGTITITNVGVFGVDTGTPILNPGESGIVAFGAVRRMPWVVPGPGGTEAIEPRWVTQLAVSFDHRIVDGQQGSQFLSDVAAVLTDPGLGLL